jgi:hypothetical protein
MGAATPVLRNTGPVVSCVAAGSLIVPLDSEDECGTHSDVDTRSGGTRDPDHVNSVISHQSTHELGLSVLSGFVRWTAALSDGDLPTLAS